MVFLTVQGNGGMLADLLKQSNQVGFPGGQQEVLDDCQGVPAGVGEGRGIRQALQEEAGGDVSLGSGLLINTRRIVSPGALGPNQSGRSARR